MANVGEYVLCRGIGVCRVAETGDDAAWVVPYLAPEQKQQVDKAQIVRPVMDKRAAEEATLRMPYLQTIRAPKENLVCELISSAFESYDPIEWIRIVKTAYIRGQDARLVSMETPHAEQAKTYLHSELAVALGVPYAEIEAHIAPVIEEDMA